jgi:hypothetical protein
MYEFKYARRMKQKLFIDAVSNNIQLVVEYNVIDDKANINWINDITNGHDNFLDSLGVEADRKVIEQAIEFAKGLKQYKEIISKYN